MIKLDKTQLGKVASLLAGVTAVLPAGCRTEEKTAAPLPDTPVSQTVSTGQIGMPKILNECDVEFLGVDPSRDMLSYLTEKNPKMLNYTEIPDGSPSESLMSDLCSKVYLMRREELVKNGVRNMAYGTADGQFTFAANFGDKGNFAVTFDIESHPTETSVKFDNALKKLLELLKDVD